MKVAVAMSGGVDSSVTAALLTHQGHQVIGITMRLFNSCLTGTGSAAHDAGVVAGHLGIPHHVVDFEPEFRELIINDFIREYGCAQTPNPCVRCNRFIKFGLLLEKARELGAEFMATGHYVRKSTDPDGTSHLLMARNIHKDQSYFLYTLTQERLRQLIFPLGDIETKEEVRRLAREYGLPVAEKSDSQEVCFIPGDDYVAFLEASGALTCTPGDIIHRDGQVIGKHLGTHRYTIGQRKGLGIAWSEPLYVVAIDAGQNRVVAGEQRHVFAGGLTAGDVSWIQAPLEREFSSSCKIRYRHAPIGCHVRLLEEGGCEVRFNDPQKAVTPGQSVVFYRGGEVIGGGRILSAIS
ncbi:MAG: tRNA 2-thiouridine(34) synthase MnmA [Geobacteraceae bacterium]|nr:tRNA 2-thiouridine(34) synthase MnmA [Geobacteraceae bacterium]